MDISGITSVHGATLVFLGCVQPPNVPPGPPITHIRARSPVAPSSSQVLSSHEIDLKNAVSGMISLFQRDDLGWLILGICTESPRHPRCPPKYPDSIYRGLWLPPHSFNTGGTWLVIIFGGSATIEVQLFLW